jgi:drug/metabolite transporter (DMT)-like permease
VVFWSFGSSLVFLGAREAGTWRLIAIASLSGGGVQLISRRIYHGELTTAVWLPWRLWVAPLVCFVLYGLVWPRALATATRTQVGGVNLINYLWPVLTVLFSVWWVPGVKLTIRLVLGMTFAMAGLACANAQQLQLLHSNSNRSLLSQLLPYALAMIAALTWAIYSALLARWRTWARNYVTSPIGFLLIGSIACSVLAFGHLRLGKMSLLGLLFTILYGVGPLGAGYLLWELALARAKVQSLSMLAAATPVLSTLVLCCFLRQSPGIELVAAALLVSAGVVLSMRA